MAKQLLLVKIDTEYCNYLRKYDDKVPYNFEEKESRPFIGILLEVNGCTYYAPLSSPKAKYIKLKNKLDFLKINNGKLGVINFNNMIPVTKNNVIVINLNNKDLNDYEKKYFSLLKEQLYWLNRNNDKLYSRANKLYNKYIDNTLNESIKARCCNFKLLEDKCIEYNNF